MDTVWSSSIQTAETLYNSRALRFADDFKEKYIGAFALRDPGCILEVGCGPGALAQALARWYPNTAITGVDRDSRFIRFASEKAPDIRFVEANIAALPFESDSFDVTISNTVVEHIPPDSFFGEQYRVLRPGGICLVLSARKGIQAAAPCIAEEAPLETEVYQRLAPHFQTAMDQNGVGKYRLRENELPAVMQQYGFQHVTVQYLTIDLAPDDPKYAPDLARAMIHAERQNELDVIHLMANSAPEKISAEELAELRKIKNRRYDERLALYEAGDPQWDVNLSLTMVVRGVK